MPGARVSDPDRRTGDGSEEQGTARAAESADAGSSALSRLLAELVGSPPTERVRRLRRHALGQTTIPRDEPELLWARAWLAASGEPWQIVRRARATAGVLRGLTPAVDADELLVGKFSSRELTATETAELARWREHAAPAVQRDLGQRAHMAIDYDKLLRLGLRGIREQVVALRARLRPEDPADLERDAFYRACLICLDALGDLFRRYADAAAALAAPEPDPARRAELDQIARACRRVAAEPPETFREALQAVHLVTFALCAGQRMLLFQLGRPDRYLLPLYRRDVAAGRLTPGEAQELIDCLCLLLTEYTPRGLAVGFMVGGRDAAGGDVSNELTWHFLESIAHTRLAYPGVGLCWHAGTPPALLQRAAELLADGCTHPALFNDEVITAGLLAAGLPPAEACLYVQSTCVEITPIASSNVYVASPYVNLVQCLHDVLGVPGLGAPGAPVVETPPAASFASFDDLLTAFRARLAAVLREGVIQQSTAQISRRYHGGFPLLSCFVNDCLARGLDIDHGGARHNWIEPSFVGLANLVDSLAAIRTFVFEQREGRRELTLAELAAALRDGFAGREPLRQALLNRAPKYGNDDEAVDALAVWVTDAVVAECGRYRTYLGGAVHPGLFCWIMHERLGRQTGASADGRPAGFPLSDGSGAAQGRERHGPTAALRSATRWRHTPMLGGIAVNLKFTRGATGGALAATLVPLAEAYLRQGGFELQVNVVDRATLLAARANPEQHRDLVVRVAGYSDYFVGLPAGMQEEIIQRTEHSPQ